MQDTRCLPKEIESCSRMGYQVGIVMFFCKEFEQTKKFYSIEER